MVPLNGVYLECHDGLDGRMKRGYDAARSLHRFRGRSRGRFSMGVMVVMTVPGDTAQFEAFISANGARITEVSESAKASGCTGHRFAVGDGQIVVVDYWDSAEQFQKFISQPDLQALMGEMGAQGEPVVTIADPKGFPGEF
ncbi:MAG: hypothetical protein ACHQFZ_06050 [Acidimicrobiales bacterium]